MGTVDHPTTLTFLSDWSSNSLGRPGDLMEGAIEWLRFCTSCMARMMLSLSLKGNWAVARVTHLFLTKFFLQRMGSERRMNSILAFSVKESLLVARWLSFRQGGELAVGGTRVTTMRDSSLISWKVGRCFEYHMGIWRNMFLGKGWVHVPGTYTQNGS